MFGCRRLDDDDEDLKFPWLKSVSNRLQHGSGVKPFSLFYFFFSLCLAVLVNERFVLVRVILAYGHSSSCISHLMWLELMFIRIVVISM